MRSIIALAVLLVSAAADNSTVSDSCDVGPWGSLLEEWTVSADVHSDRQGRVMAVPIAKGYYLSNRIDNLAPPPPPYQSNGPHYTPDGPHYTPDGPLQANGHYPDGQYSQFNGPQYQGPHSQSSGAHSQSNPQYSGPQYTQTNGPTPPPAHGPPLPVSAPAPLHPRPYSEWHPSPPPPGKILNRPSKPNKEQFKPSYPGPPPTNNHWSAADRVDEPPRKQVTETDLYLLTAIEKLVYRVDLMEKRLRRLEESVHYVVAGAEPKPDPCKSNFTRLAGRCYHVSGEAQDWKSANLACRKLKASLLELDSEAERRTFTSGLLADKRLKGTDYWTGGLNPGLLWIWSHSARPVAGNNTNNTDSPTVVGEGRCLAYIHDPAVNNYVYRGQDCALKHRFICQKEEDKQKLSNEIARVAKKLRDTSAGVKEVLKLRRSKMDRHWSSEEDGA